MNDCLLLCVFALSLSLPSPLKFKLNKQPFSSNEVTSFRAKPRLFTPVIRLRRCSVDTWLHRTRSRTLSQIVPLDVRKELMKSVSSASLIDILRGNREMNLLTWKNLVPNVKWPFVNVNFTSVSRFHSD